MVMVRSILIYLCTVLDTNYEECQVHSSRNVLTGSDRLNICCFANYWISNSKSTGPVPFVPRLRSRNAMLKPHGTATRYLVNQHPIYSISVFPIQPSCLQYIQEINHSVCRKLRSVQTLLYLRGHFSTTLLETPDFPIYIKFLTIH